MIKKIFYALSLVLLSTACNQDDLQEQIPLTDEVKEICATIKGFEFEESDFSRTSITIEEDGPHYAWAETDTIGIFPNVGRQVEFSMAGGAGSTSAKFTGGGWGLKSTSTYAAYYPLIGQYYLDKTAIPVDYTGQVQNGNNSTAHLGTYDYLAAPASKVNNGIVSFNFERLGCLVQLKLTLPQATTLQSVTLTTDSEAFAIKGKVDIMAKSLDIQPTISSKNMTLEVKNVSTTEANQVVTLYMMIPPLDLSAKQLKGVIKTDVATEEVSLNSKNFQAGKAYALAGAIEKEDIVGNGTYKDGVVSLAEAGTISKLLGDDYLSTTSLKVVGPINGDDIKFLRAMCGYEEYKGAYVGNVSYLDLSDASIVEGGDYYYDGKYKTSKNSIGKHMFMHCNQIEKIILPKNITKIDYGAFYNCVNLKEINLSESLINISDLAFYQCSMLSNINIPNSVETIGYSAFYGCSNLKNVTLGYNIASIGESAFRGCEKLVEINIPDKVSKIEQKTFYDCYSLTTIFLGGGVTEIKDYAFYYCSSLKNISFPEKLTHIRANSFSSCSSIANLDIPNSVEYIGYGAFRYCESLETLKLGNKVKTIGGCAFYNCPKLKTVYCYTVTPPYSAEFSDIDENAELFVPKGSISSYRESSWGDVFYIKEMN